MLRIQGRFERRIPAEGMQLHTLPHLRRRQLHGSRTGPLQHAFRNKPGKTERAAKGLRSTFKGYLFEFFILTVFRYSPR